MANRGYGVLEKGATRPRVLHLPGSERRSVLSLRRRRHIDIKRGLRKRGCAAADWLELGQPRTSRWRRGRHVPTDGVSRAEDTTISPAGPLTLAALALGSTWAIRGPRRSLPLPAIAGTIVAGGEALAIRGTRTLRHHSQPQIGELPVLIPLLCYTYVAPCYGLAQAAVAERGPEAVSLVTALLATATDLANDPYGLASGFWEWRDGEPYMADIVGGHPRRSVERADLVGMVRADEGVPGDLGRRKRAMHHTDFNDARDRPLRSSVCSWIGLERRCPGRSR